MLKQENMLRCGPYNVVSLLTAFISCILMLAYRMVHRIPTLVGQNVVTQCQQ
jgi:hypothetical protein